MKNYLLLIFLVLGVVFGAVAQIGQTGKPISWKYTTSATQVSTGQTVDLIFSAELQGDWYLYSSDMKFEQGEGPTVTTFTFTPDASYQLIGSIKPINAKKKFDKTWGIEISYFNKKAEFRQTVKVLKDNFKVQGNVDYQVCSDAKGSCIPFDDDFGFSGLKVLPAEKQAEKPVEKPAGNLPENDSSTLEKPVAQDSVPRQEKVVDTTATDQNKQRPSEASLLEPEDKDQSLLAFMLVAFGSGLLGLLTPCVFPMIPMTVAFFTNRNKSRAAAIAQAAMYGFSVILIYSLIGLLVQLVGEADSANAVATHWLTNLVFFAVFIIFALSFFGAFELVLPGSWVAKIDAQADRGGYVGIFFMAFTLVLVSFSCTGPIIGSILIEASRGGGIRPTAGMFAFAAAFAIPFTLFAIFPSWLNSLPKSGGWLNAVKVVLGFIELALAFKFLSVADQVYHWGILDREIYIAIWTAIAFCLGLYLLGKITLPHDSPAQHIGVVRLLLAIASFVFVIYLIPGMFGAPLKALAGYLPPQTTHDFDLATMIQQNQGTTAVTAERPAVKYGDRLKLPHGLFGYFDYKEGMAAAKAANKPVFIDFTGHGCVNCREMEAAVWSDPEVLRRLKNDYIVIGLYVDDRYELPESEWITSKHDGKVKKTMGKVNGDFQITRFNNNAQPFYVLLDTEGGLMVKPKTYDSSVSNFIHFLDEGIKEFKRRK